jgi:two-component system, NtrC family, sensor kinase
MNRDSAGGHRAAALLEELRWEERRRAVSWVAAVVGHMIGTPLNVISGRAALIRLDPGAPAVVANATRIEAQVEKLAQRLRNFLQYLAPVEPGPDTRPVDALIGDAVSAYEPVARDRRLTLAVRPADLPQTPVERMSTLVGLTGVLSLALRSATAGSTVELDVDDRVAGTVAVRLFVAGLALPQVSFDGLEPPTQIAHGDGAVAERIQVLSLCGAVVRRHGGRLEVIPAAPMGSVIRLECPPGIA